MSLDDLETITLLWLNYLCSRIIGEVKVGESQFGVMVKASVRRP